MQSLKLRSASLIAAMLLLVLSQSQAWADPAAEISAFRRSHGLSAVVIDSKLVAVADAQARAMAAQDKVSHNVIGPFELRVAKLNRRAAAENVAAGSLTFSETLKQWIASPGHKENLLIPQVRKIGIASANNPTSRYKKFWALILSE